MTKKKKVCALAWLFSALKLLPLLVRRVADSR